MIEERFGYWVELRGVSSTADAADIAQSAFHSSELSPEQHPKFISSCDDKKINSEIALGRNAVARSTDDASDFNHPALQSDEPTPEQRSATTSNGEGIDPSHLASRQLTDITSCGKNLVNSCDSGL